MMSIQRFQLLLCGALIFNPAALLYAQDVVHFDNGDRLTGQIKRLQRGEVVFSAPLFDGDILIDWRRINQIESGRTFQFETSFGERFLGRIVIDPAGSADSAVLRIDSPDGEKRIRQEDLVLAVETGERLEGLLQANIGAGLTLSKSNNQKQANADIDLSYTTTRFAATAAVSSIFSTQQDTDSTSRHNVTLGFSRKLAPNWSTSLVADFLTSEEQQLDLRTILGGGPTRTFISNNRTILYSTAGAVWNSERFSPESGEEVPTNNQIEGLATLGFTYFQFRMWTVDSVFRLFPSITSGGRVRADWRTSLHVRLRRGKPLWWNFNQTINLDNRPPGDTPGTDYVTSSSLSWSFP